jgi:glyoxylase-like metal-dependent hydrolase (beta-lactamase superfamily II)
MEQRAISDYIKAEGLKPVIYVLTHGHFDHTMGGKWLYDTYGLQPTICERDAELYKNFREDIASMIGYQVDYDLPFIGHCLNDGDNITFGNSTFKVINTPGHSKGSVVFYNKENKVAFTGDTLFRGSIGRTDLPGGSMFQMINSLRLLEQLPDDTTIYPGHGPETTMKLEGATNPYLDR